MSIKLDLNMPKEIDTVSGLSGDSRSNSEKLDAKIAKNKDKIALLKRELELAKEHRDEVERGYNKDMQNLNLRIERRSTYFVEKARTCVAQTRTALKKSAIGEVIDQYTFRLVGEKTSLGVFSMFSENPEKIEVIQKDADVMSYNDIKNTIGKEAIFGGLENVTDPFQRKQLARNRVRAFMIQMQSYNLKDDGELYAIMKLPLIGFGYGIGGKILGTLSARGVALNSLNTVEVAKGHYYQMRRQAQNLHVEESKMVSGLIAYGINLMPEWIQRNIDRAGTTDGKRIHFWEHVKVPEGTYVQMSEIEREAVITNKEGVAKHNASQLRLFADLIWGMGGR